jgi:hypothetical protein
MMRGLLMLLTLASIRLSAQDSVPATIAESTARRIVLERVHGSTVRSERFERRDGRVIYTYEMAVRGQPNDVAVRVDGTTGAVLGLTPIRGRGDSAAIADVKKEGTLKDTAAMPPNTLKDTAAGRTRDSSARPPAPTPPATPPPH